ncbi:hypothetical protein JTE90_023108 [Oedothorax gibbosus]|uniref:Uncharacterized protein n=1 Tax=Oedothorax gibbosus TaxID=931172 RepID=A0AAV6ULS8_9ARAC|nr:hypothetical protein JTE90_023108 [Oedothorax gibbosus]
MSDQEKVVHADQLESTTLALRFRLKPDVIHNGKVVLKCVASVQNIHAETIREIIAGTRPTEIHKGLLYTAAILMLILHVTQMNQPV